MFYKNFQKHTIANSIRSVGLGVSTYTTTRPLKAPINIQYDDHL